MRYSLDEIETFLAVMELGTVTAAAARQTARIVEACQNLGSVGTHEG